MNNTKVKVYRSSNKDNRSVNTNQILKEINKITATNIKSRSAYPYQQVEMKHGIPEMRQSVVRKESCRSFRTQASQTELCGPNEYEGIIRYPSTRVLEVKPKKEIGLQVDQISPRHPHEMGGATLLKCSKLPEKTNQLPTKAKLKITGNKTDPCRAPPSYQKGIIPKYLQKLREDGVTDDIAIRKCSINVKTMVQNQTGLHNKLQLEREQKLAIWHENYKKMVSELNILTAA